jgi:hypothetical protein
VVERRYSTRVEALWRLLWSARLVSKLAFVGGVAVSAFLIVHCGSDTEPPAAATGSAAAQISYDEFHRALDDSGWLAEACVGSVRVAFDRAQLAGVAPDKPPANRGPVDRNQLQTAVAFEVPISVEGDVANFAPEGWVPIHELQHAALYADVHHDDICGIHDKLDALYMWPDQAAKAIAKLRAPKHVPELVLFYWRWCDHELGSDGPFTCSNGLAWMRLPSKEIVAMASGSGTAKRPAHPPKDSSEAPYVLAMHRAEEQLVNVVRSWK